MHVIFREMRGKWGKTDRKSFKTNQGSRFWALITFGDLQTKSQKTISDTFRSPDN